MTKHIISSLLERAALDKDFVDATGEFSLPVVREFSAPGRAYLLKNLGGEVSHFRVGRFALIICKKGYMAALIYEKETWIPSMDDCTSVESPYYVSSTKDRRGLISQAMVVIKRYPGHSLEKAILADAKIELDFYKSQDHLKPVKQDS